MTTAPPPPARPVNTSRLAPRQARSVAPKIVFAAVEGFGKTSFLAHAPSPLLLMARGETGYDTLLSAGRVPAIPAEIIDSHQALLAKLDDVIANDYGIKTLGLDAGGGFARLTNEMVTVRDFKGAAGDPGFLSYGKGDRIAEGDWAQVLVRLETLNAKGVTVVILCHTKTKTFPNPQGADYQRYISDMDDFKWNLTARWADAVLFGVFYVDVQAPNKAAKGKATGGNARHLYTGAQAVMPSKNRYGMDPLIELPDDPALVWGVVWSQIVRKDA